jgi:hypothetical protein
MIDKLQEYFNLSNDENGEYIEALLNLFGYEDYIREDLRDELMRNIETMVEFFDDNFEIVKIKETKEIEWEELESL